MKILDRVLYVCAGMALFTLAASQIVPEVALFHRFIFAVFATG